MGKEAPTMTTNNGNSYPFASRAQVARRLTVDAPFARSCVALLQDRYERRTSLPSPCGWMASHVTRGTSLAHRVADGQVEDKELLEAGSVWLCVYARQLAATLRAQDLASRPELAATAAMFGVLPLVSAFPAGAAGVAEANAAASHPEGHEGASEPPGAAGGPAASTTAERPTGLEARVLAVVEACPGIRLDAVVREAKADSGEVISALEALSGAGWIEAMGKGRWMKFRAK
jgi:hypothetical protein